MSEIHGHRLGVSQCAHRLIEGSHGEQHAFHIRVLYDRHAALDALAGVGDRFLIGTLRCAKTLQADLEPRLVHHGEHTGETLVLLSDEITNGPAIVTVGHHAGWTPVDTQLVFHGNRISIIALTQRTVCIHHKFGHQKK